MHCQVFQGLEVNKCGSLGPKSSVYQDSSWSMGQAQDTYIRYEAAGDMFVGHTVAGLPLNSPNFTLLPPHFIEPQDQLVHICFPFAPANMLRVLEMCLASVVYHLNFVRESVNPKSPLFSSPLFTSKFDLEALKAKIHCGTSSSVMTATGIPPQVELFTSIAQLKSSLDAVVPAIEAVVPKSVAGFEKVIEESDSSKRRDSKSTA